MSVHLLLAKRLHNCMLLYIYVVYIYVGVHMFFNS